MGASGTVVVTVVDNAGSTAIAVPSTRVIAVGGCSSIGTANQPISTRDVPTLVSAFGYGPLVQLCALLISLGGIVLASKFTQTAAGTATAVVPGSGNTGATVLTITLDGTAGAFDTFNVKVICPVGGGGTIGTAAKIQVSLDAGRVFGQVIDLGVATTYAIPKTGITLNFTVATLVAGDTFVFSTVEPTANAAGVTSWLAAMQASVYAQEGWGNMIGHGPRTGSDVNTINAQMDVLADGYLYDRLMLNARDAAAPVAWGGAGETAATWRAALLTSFAAASARRCLVSAGHYNMPSGINDPVFGTPKLRRPASWAFMARRVGGGGGAQGALPVQRLGSEPALGQLDQILVDPSSDPFDGYIYHDERNNPTFDSARFASVWTRARMGQGFFERSENLMSPLGSDFDLYPVGQCFDNFCGVLQVFFTSKIDQSVLRKKTGQINPADAQRLEREVMIEVANTIPGQYDPSSTSVVIDLDYNVKTNKKAKVTGTHGGLAYVREFDVTALVQNPSAA